MATIDELAEAFVTVLRSSPVPEPLPVHLMNHGAADTGQIVRSVIDRCAESGMRLAKVKIDPALADSLRAANLGRTFSYNGVPIVEDASLKAQVEFYRRTQEHTP